MSAMCPSCGVAVVPGYVRCPKCQAPLPASARRLSTRAAGGTAVAPRGGLPIVPIAAAVAVTAAIIAFFSLRGDDDNKRPVPAQPTTTQPATTATTPTTPTTPVAPVDTPDDGNNIRPSPAVVAADLERALRRQRLWSTLEVFGTRLDIRSGSCAEAAMGPTIDAARDALRNAGLTRLRCLEQSGAVAFERDL